MKELFLSASVPYGQRAANFPPAEPYLIQYAVREFALSVLGKRKIIYGGHPSITPMLWAICQELNLEPKDHFELYQSRFFDEQFPDENKRFDNVVFVDKKSTKQDSLMAMREQMLSRKNLTGGLFIGGMEGIIDEHDMFARYNPKASILALRSPGGAADTLAQKLNLQHQQEEATLNFNKLFYQAFGL